MKKLFLIEGLVCGSLLLHACGGGASGGNGGGGGGGQLTATYFSVTAPATTTAGTAFNFTVTARDASNNLVTSYFGTVHFTSTDSQGSLPANSMLTNGMGTFSATFESNASQTITVSDTITPSLTGTSSPINVGLPATHFSVTAPATDTAGVALNFTVTALDPFNDIVTNYSGAVHFTSTDLQASLPANSMLTNGSRTFPATFETIASQTITATDTLNPSITGTSNQINVGVPATHFSVTAPATATIGAAFDFIVTAQDASNKIVTTYSGTVHFTSTDLQASLPANAMLATGTANFPASFKNMGIQSITATDTLTASITGTSNSIDVSGSAAANPVPFINEPLNPDAMVPGGTAFNLTVNGTGFVPGAVVKWNGAPRITTFVGNSRLTAQILATDIANFITASVTVVNPAPGGGTSNGAFFEITRPASTVLLSVKSGFNGGPLPLALATADFNGDGVLDLVTTSQSNNSVGILLGNGDGTFQAAVNYATGSFPSHVAVGDFNGDGKLDLVVVNNASDSVGILLGNGDGTFQAAVNYPVGTSPLSVAVGDFNGDGKLDLVVANYAGGNVSVLLGNGNGTFQSALEFNAGAGPSSLAVGDFNGDNKLDLAVGNGGSANVSILLGNGDGTFKPAVNYPLGPGSYPSSVAVGDLNGEGKLDLVFAGPQNASVFVLIGNGDGSFQPATSYGTPSGPRSIAIGDFNGDSKPDLVVANDISRNVSLLLGNGDGTFQPAVNYGAGLSPSSLAFGDFNGDGRLDIAVADSLGSSISVLVQPGDVSGPGAALSSASLTFATQVLDTTSPSQTLTLLNDGSAPLHIANITPPLGFMDTNTCGSSLVTGANCTISVTFSPTTVDLVAGSLMISDDAPGSPQTVNLQGEGTVMKLVPTGISFVCIAFRGQCPPPPKTATLTNTGKTTVHITSIKISYGSFSQKNNCPASLGPAQSCTITVSFIAGPVFSRGVLLVSDDGGASPQEIALTGAED